MLMSYPPLINLNNLGACKSDCTEFEIILLEDQYGELFPTLIKWGKCLGVLQKLRVNTGGRQGLEKEKVNMYKMPRILFSKSFVLKKC